MTTFNVESLPLPIVHSDFSFTAKDVDEYKKSLIERRREFESLAIGKFPDYEPEPEELTGDPK